MKINKEILKQRKWPVPNFPIGQEVLDRTSPDDPKAICDDNGMPLIPKEGYTYSGKEWPLDYSSSNFIPTNKFTSCPLTDIPFGSCAVKQLIQIDDTIYGISGNESETWFFAVKDQKISKVCKIANNASPKAIGSLNNEPYILLSNGTICDQNSNVILHIDKNIVNAQADKNIFAGSIDNQTVFIANLKDKSIKFAQLPAKKTIDPAFAILDKTMYGVCSYGELFSFDGEKITLLNCKIPSFAGRIVYNQASVLIYDKTRNLIWGGTSEDGILFSYDIAANKVRNYGKMVSGRGIQALTIDGDKIYGIGTKNCCHIFSRDITTGEIIDYGMINQSEPRTWCVYEVYSIIVPTPGTLLLGEAERISHLFWLNMQ